MKTTYIKVLLLPFLFCFSGLLIGQEKNISVEKLHSDANSSTFIISVRDSVSAHYHKSHTENLFVLKGEARMRIGEKKFSIKKGDYFTIPEGTVHSVWVTSDIPLKVVSVQAPEFKGEDRYFVNE